MGIAAAIGYGLWGAFTLALILMVVSKTLQAIQAETECILARDKMAAALEQYQTLSAYVKTLLDRPAVAVFTTEQVRQLAAELKFQSKSDLRIN